MFIFFFNSKYWDQILSCLEACTTRDSFLPQQSSRLSQKELFTRFVHIRQQSGKRREASPCVVFLFSLSFPHNRSSLTDLHHPSQLGYGLTTWYIRNGHFLSISYKKLFKPTKCTLEKVGPSLAKRSHCVTRGHGGQLQAELFLALWKWQVFYDVSLTIATLFPGDFTLIHILAVSSYGKWDWAPTRFARLNYLSISSDSYAHTYTWKNPFVQLTIPYKIWVIKTLWSLFLRGAHSKAQYAKPNSFIAWQKKGSVYAESPLRMRKRIGPPHGPHSLGRVASRAANEFVSEENWHVRKH